MELFFERPVKTFQLREISRLTKIAVTSVKNYVKELVKENLILKTKTSIYLGYVANESGKMFKVYKRQTMILKLHKSGFVEYIERVARPSAIVLFGSAGKGEYTEKSDIDIFVQSSEYEFKLEKFEKILKHRINILFESNLDSLSKELLNNLANGVVLSGYLRVKK